MLSSGSMNNIQYYQLNQALGQAWRLPHTYPNTQSSQFFHRPVTSCWLAGRTAHLCHCSPAVLQWSDGCMKGDSPCVAWKILARCREGDGTIFSLLTSLTVCKVSHECDVLCVCTFAQTWVKISHLFSLTFSPEWVHLNACSQSWRHIPTLARCIVCGTSTYIHAHILCVHNNILSRNVSVTQSLNRIIMCSKPFFFLSRTVLY